MKLLNVINRKYAFFSVILLLSGMVIIYIFLQYFINRETLEKLQNTKQDVIRSLDGGNKVEFYPLVEIRELGSDYSGNKKEVIGDTAIFNKDENEPDSYKQISFVYSSNGKEYLVYVRTDNLETSDILLPLGLPAFFLVLTILLISNIFINRVNYRIWKDFYQNLSLIKNFSASDKNEIQLIDSNIDEFRDLNNALTGLTNHVRNDFRKLKEFSENASHELQTPLTIIKVKIESMLQNEKLGEEQLEKIQSVYKMINRLSRLNHSLTLLSKLESIEYEKKSKISLKEFIERKIGDFTEIAETRGIIFEKDIQYDKKVTANTDLLEILFSNLFSNAIKYNEERGKIIIGLFEGRLVIKNNGRPPSKEPDRMFERFEKGEQSDESSGLGLTIVKQICSMNRFDISYVYENSFHIIQITFPE